MRVVAKARTNPMRSMGNSRSALSARCGGQPPGYRRRSVGLASILTGGLRTPLSTSRFANVKSPVPSDFVWFRPLLRRGLSYSQDPGHHEQVKAPDYYQNPAQQPLINERDLDTRM